MSQLLRNLHLPEGLVGLGGKSLFRVKLFCAGQKLITEGQPSLYVYIIVDGECRVVKESAAPSRVTRVGSRVPAKVNMLLSSGFCTKLDVSMLGILGRNALVGDISVLLATPECASVECCTKVTVLQVRISGSLFMPTSTRNAPICLNADAIDLPHDRPAERNSWNF